MDYIKENSGLETCDGTSISNESRCNHRTGKNRTIWQRGAREGEKLNTIQEKLYRSTNIEAPMFQHGEENERVRSTYVTIYTKDSSMLGTIGGEM